MTANKEIKRYFLYNFLINVIKTGDGSFTMVYFYLHGFSVIALIGAILTYGITALIILKPVGMLIHKIGPQKTFRLHFISEILKYLSLLGIFLLPEYRFTFFLLLQFFNGFNVMLSRIPLNAYFSTYGNNNERGLQIGLANNTQIIANIIAPVIAGALIEKTGLILISGFSALVNILAIFVLKFDSRVKMDDPVDFKKLFSSVPKVFTQSFFFGNLVYPFISDLISVYIAIQLKSFVVFGALVSARVGASIFLNYLIGRMTDARMVRTFFFWGVLVSSTFWLVIPFVNGIKTIFLLQFTLGLAGLFTSIPFESAYHNVAKQSRNSLQFSIMREVAIQAGMVIGCVFFIGILKLDFVSNWKYLLPLGAFSTLAMLFVMPYIDDVRNKYSTVTELNQ